MKVNIKNKLALNNNYPSMDQIIPPALLYFIIFGIIRTLLTDYLFKPLAVFALNIDIINIEKNNFY
jgi:hypothetical protein